MDGGYPAFGSREAKGNTAVLPYLHSSLTTSMLLDAMTHL